MIELTAPFTTRPCWICGNPADSREHKFKKSDVSLSSKSWAPSDQPYFVSGGIWRRIQGPDSQLVKFEKVLCQKCNTTRTQPFDLAYERFADWVNRKGADLMTEPQIDFAEIYSDDWQNGVLNLLKYFAKHLGCRLASDNYALPPSLASSLGTDNLSPFEVSLARNAELAGFPVRGAGMLHNFPLLGYYSPRTGAVHHPYISGTIVGYLDIVYRYDYGPRYAWEGDRVLSSNRIVRLGSYVPGASHPTNGLIPGSETARKLQIGEVEFIIPVLTPEHAQQLLSLGLPSSDMTTVENLEARLRIAHAILSPFYPDVTMSFLKENLTLPESDALWNCVFPSTK
jgi:hypothetical protein